MSSKSLKKSAARMCTILGFVGGLSACEMPAASPEVGHALRGNGLAPPGAPTGTCWGKVETPAVVESVSEQILVTPAQINPDGTITKLPVYRTEDRQKIVVPRGERWFETPCPPSFTVEFVSSLQRALIARGLYSGPVNGSMDTATRNAVLAVQRSDGLDSDVLSIEMARTLGLVVTKSPNAG